MEFFFNFYLLIAGYCPQMNRLYTQKYMHTTENKDCDCCGFYCIFRM